MEFSEETHAMIVGEILESSFLGNPPATEDAMRGYARAIATFVNNEEEVRWLFARIRSGCMFFPKPIEARKIHGRKYTAADKNPDGSPMRVDQADMTEWLKTE